MIQFDFKAIKASSVLYDYLSTVYKNKRLKDFKKLLFVQIQLNRLEAENFKAKELINDRQSRLIVAERERAQLKSDISLLKNEAIRDQKIIQEQIKTIDNLTEGMIARCDNCGSEN